jgi:hypothetical protein
MMVAERSFSLGKKVEKFFGEKRDEYAGMSSDQQCAKHCRQKLQGFEARLILFNKNVKIHDKTAPKKKNQC